ALRPHAPAGRWSDHLAGLGPGRDLPRPEHPRLLPTAPRGATARALARRRNRRRALAQVEPRRRDRRLGDEAVTEERPAFYALAPGGWRDYVTLLHPPYTLWHLSYVAIGAALAPHFRGGIFGLALLAFFLGMGVAAHALDELHGRPLETRIGRGTLMALATVSLAGAAAIGVVAAVQTSLWL